MRTYIKKLQTKSEDTKKIILVTALSISMFIVGSIWIYGITASFNKKVEVKANKEEVKPLALFTNLFSDTYKNISASVGNVPFLQKKEEVKNTEKQIDLIVVEKE
jgi:NADH:ubiquinone oxidoreductase subunit 2 (subunit N)